MRMAELAQNYHNKLQEQNILPQNPQEHAADIEQALRNIPPQQRLDAPEQMPMNQQAFEAHVQSALKHVKNDTATGMDGCPYEL